MFNTKAATVEEYLEAFPEERRKALSTVRPLPAIGRLIASVPPVKYKQAYE